MRTKLASARFPNNFFFWKFEKRGGAKSYSLQRRVYSLQRMFKTARYPEATRSRCNKIVSPCSENCKLPIIQRLLDAVKIWIYLPHVLCSLQWETLHYSECSHINRYFSAENTIWLLLTLSHPFSLSNTLLPIPNHQNLPKHDFYSKSASFFTSFGEIFKGAHVLIIG